MKIGGKTLSLEFKPQGSIDSPLGKLAVFDISAGDMDTVRKECGGTFKDAKPQVVASRLVPFITHLEKNLGENGTKPKEPTLTPEQVNSLDQATIEKLLQIFIDNQQYLTREYVSEITTNESGQNVHSGHYGEVVHPRKEGEGNADYLQRLLALDEEKRLAEYKQMVAQFDQMIAPARFSDSLVKQISGTLEMGESLKKALDAARPVDFRQSSLPEWSVQQHVVAEPALSSIDFDAIAANAEEARWAPFNLLAERLDELVATTVQSQEFMVQMNETQTQIAAEIKASSGEANRIGEESLRVANATLEVTTKGFWLTIVVVVFTALGLLITAASWWTSTSAPPAPDNRANDIVRVLGEVKSAVVDSKQSSDNATSILNEISTAHTEVSTKLQAILDVHTQQLNRQATDQKTIEAMQQQITQLEYELRKLQPMNDSGKDKE